MGVKIPWIGQAIRKMSLSDRAKLNTVKPTYIFSRSFPDHSNFENLKVVGIRGIHQINIDLISTYAIFIHTCFDKYYFK